MFVYRYTRILIYRNLHETSFIAMNNDDTTHFVNCSEMSKRVLKVTFHSSPSHNPSLKLFKQAASFPV
jgi:hypothetical protein